MVKLKAVIIRMLPRRKYHGMTLISSDTYNLLESLHMTSLHDVRLVVATQYALENASASALRINTVFQHSVRRAEGLEYFPCLVRASRDVVLRSIRILNRQAIGSLFTTVNVPTVLGDDRWRVHLYALSSQIESVAVVVEEAQEAVTEVVWLSAVLEVADDETDDSEAPNATGVDFIHATHDKELLQQCDHIDHVGVIVLPLLECCLCLNSAEVLERNVNVDVGHTIHELDDRYLSFGNAQDVDSNADVLESLGGLPQCGVDHAPVCEVHSGCTTLIEPVGGVDKVHIGSGQIKSRRERAKTQDATGILWESLRAQCLLYSLDEAVTNVMFIGLRRDEVVEIEYFVVQPSAVSIYTGMKAQKHGLTTSTDR
jgi:hypothetical protein